MKGRFILMPLALVVAGASAVVGVSGCAPVIVAGAAAGTALVATDRRTAGAQLDDETIELRTTTAIGTAFGDRVHVNITSFNGTALVTGEVPDQATMDGVVRTVRREEKVRNVQNELVVAATTNLGDRSNDTLITSKVKARFVEANQFSATHVKVVTERGIVYLMGLVNRTEADNAARLASQTSGVTRVVRVFEYMG
jgi:osmotically-inducible protein OsmY